MSIVQVITLICALFSRLYQLATYLCPVIMISIAAAISYQS